MAPFTEAVRAQPPAPVLLRAAETRQDQKQTFLQWHSASSRGGGRQMRALAAERPEQQRQSNAGDRLGERGGAAPRVFSAEPRDPRGPRDGCVG